MHSGAARVVSVRRGPPLIELTIVAVYPTTHTIVTYLYVPTSVCQFVFFVNVRLFRVIAGAIFVDEGRQRRWHRQVLYLYVRIAVFMLARAIYMCPYNVNKHAHKFALISFYVSRIRATEPGRNLL